MRKLWNLIGAKKILQCIFFERHLIVILRCHFVSEYVEKVLLNSGIIWNTMKEKISGDLNMINIPECIREEYILIEKLKNFCKSHKLKTSQNKVELLDSILNYAGSDENADSYKEVFKWLSEAIKEGSKELCYKKIFTDSIDEIKIDEILEANYPGCPQEEILTFDCDESYKLVKYDSEINHEGNAILTSLVFLKKILEGSDEGSAGKEGIYPVYIDIYWDMGFIVSRGKAKSTIYNLSESGIIYKENKINTIKDAEKLIGRMIEVFNLESEDDSVSKQRNQKMLFRLYKEYSFTPEDIKNKIRSMEECSKDFVRAVFTTLGLDVTKAPKAMEDIEIFLEKYITTNGNMESIFKEDREAYLIKVSSDDPLQMTRISTSSAKTKPLQCTDAFFDGKKSTMRSGECKKLNLCYNRKRDYLCNFTAQFETNSGYGIIKLRYYAEECDIQDVLQKVFTNY